MRWEHKSIDTAEEIYPEPDFDVLGHSYSLSVLREHKREAFVDGARWQRNKLKSDETVERVRAYLHDTVGTETDSEAARELVNLLLTGP